MTIIDLFLSTTFDTALLAILLGLISGSFANVVAYRLPLIVQYRWSTAADTEPECAAKPRHSSDAYLKKLSLRLPRSHCPVCKETIRAWENIPIVSYIFLKGKCSKCNTPIPKQYPIVELTSAALALFIGLRYSINIQFIILLFFTLTLLTLTIIDIKHLILPDELTLLLLWFGLLVSLTNLGFDVSPRESILGAVLGYLALWIFYWSFRLITNKEGIGFGDFKLLAALGAWLGWQSILPIIMLASLSGAIYGTLSRFKSHENASTLIPFGPFLATAGLTMAFRGSEIISFYIETING
jgi:leader peptidase (prepilin peptidase)/N-methyltransferase